MQYSYNRAWHMISKLYLCYCFDGYLDMPGMT